ncbi:hypothetical protein MXD60_27035, partial [Frankia sp. AgB32]
RARGPRRSGGGPARGGDSRAPPAPARSAGQDLVPGRGGVVGELLQRLDRHLVASLRGVGDEGRAADASRARRDPPGVAPVSAGFRYAKP